MIGLNSFLTVVLVIAVVCRAEEEPADETHSNFQPPSAISPAEIPPVERFYPGKRCADDGNWCLFSVHCCSRRCGWDFHCKPRGYPIEICIPDFGRCIESQQCCSGICYGGYVCAPQYSSSQYPQIPDSPFVIGGYRGGPQPGGGYGLQPGAGMGMQPGAGFPLGRGMAPQPGGFAEQPLRG